MIPDMTQRDRLAGFVESSLSRNEQETTIHFYGDANRFNLISYSPSIVRKLLRHEYAEIEWCYVEVPDGPNRRVENIAEIHPVEDGDRIEGISATLPLGALSIKGSPRERDIPSAVVTTPADLDGLAEAFGGGE